MSENSQTNLNDHYECYIYNELQKEEIGYYQTTEIAQQLQVYLFA